MNCHGWVWALCWLFGGIVLGCVIVIVWDGIRSYRAMTILWHDLRRDDPPAFRGGEHE